MINPEDMQKRKITGQVTHAALGCQEQKEKQPQKVITAVSEPGLKPVTGEHKPIQELQEIQIPEEASVPVSTQHQSATVTEHTSQPLEQLALTGFTVSTHPYHLPSSKSLGKAKISLSFSI